MQMKIDSELKSAIEHELEKGTKKRPYACYDLSDGFDLCRAYNRPIWVRPTSGEETGELWKLFPSGRAEEPEGQKQERMRKRLRPVGWDV